MAPPPSAPRRGKSLPPHACRSNTVHRVDGIGIRELPRKSGEGVYFRVEVPASVTGSRVLKQFTRLDHAKGYAAQVAAQRERQGRAAFGLTDGQRIEAQKCCDRLPPLNMSRPKIRRLSRCRCGRAKPVRTVSWHGPLARSTMPRPCRVDGFRDIGILFCPDRTRGLPGAGRDLARFA